MNQTISTIGAWFEKVKPILRKIGYVIGQIGLWIFRLRRFIMAIPVIYLAVKIARENMERLPESVGINLQQTGDFALYVSRQYAVYGPLAITMFCLLLMFCSRKTVFPWVISIFTLVLPYLIYFSNFFG